MEKEKLIEYQRKLLGDPDNGVEPELSIEEMDVNSEEYQALRPYIMGESEWPEAETEAPAAEEENLETEVGEAAPVEAGDPPADDVAELDIEAPAVVEARDRVSMREKARKEYEAKVAEFQDILNEEEPDDEFSQEHKDWRKRQKAATLGLQKANGDYLLARDTEDVEIHRSVVQKSEFSGAIRSIGESFPELKLPRPYDTMVSEYNTWAGKCIAASGGTDLAAAYQKFQSDPEFAKKVGPLPSGHETLFVYMHAVEAQKANGGPLDGHVLSIANREGIFKTARARSNAAAAAALADKNAKALNDRSTEQRPAGVKSGTQDAPKAIVRPHKNMTQEQAMDWLEDYQHRMDKIPARELEEQAHLRDIAMEVINGGSVGRSYHV